MAGVDLAELGDPVDLLVAVQVGAFQEPPESLGPLPPALQLGALSADDGLSNGAGSSLLGELPLESGDRLLGGPGRLGGGGGLFEDRGCLPLAGLDRAADRHAEPGRLDRALVWECDGPRAIPLRTVGAGAH